MEEKKKKDDLPDYGGRLSGNAQGAYQRALERRQDGFPYVHWEKSSFDFVLRSAQGGESVEGILADTRAVYDKHAKKVRDMFKKFSNSQTDEEALAKLTSVEALLNYMIRSDDLREEAKRIDVFTKKENEMTVQGHTATLQAFSQVEKNRLSLFEDVDNLVSYIDNVSRVVDEFYKVPDSHKKKIITSLKAHSQDKGKADVLINNYRKECKSSAGDPRNAFLQGLTDVLGPDGTRLEYFSDQRADVAMKNLVILTDNLKNYAERLKSRKSDPDFHLDPLKHPDDKLAESWIRVLAGYFNGVKGGAFEVAVQRLLQSAMNRFQKQVVGMSGTGRRLTRASTTEYLSGDSLVSVRCFIEGADPAGASSVSTDKIDRKVVSKSDVNVNMNFGPDSASMVLGLSLKTNKFVEDSDGNYNVTTSLVGKANYQDLLKRANMLDSKPNYDMLNIVSHGYTGHTKSVAAMKRRLAAELALEVVVGTGSAHDSALFIVYTHKIVNVADFFQALAQGKKSPLEASIVDPVKGASFSNDTIITTTNKKGETTSSYGYEYWKKNYGKKDDYAAALARGDKSGAAQIAKERSAQWVKELYRRMRINVVNKQTYGADELV